MVKREDMRKEEYKHLLSYAANLITLAVQALLFGYMWYSCYVPILIETKQEFWRRGNWAVIGMYILIVFFFTKVFGGYSIGYLRITDICLAQSLALLCANVVGYVQICIVGKDYMPVRPMLLLLLAEVLLVIPWVYLIRYVYTRLYPPRKMLVIYGEYSPTNLIKKINSRQDKYDVCATESVKVGYEELYGKILQYEAVVLCDLPSQIRNQILKFCYDQKKRTYVTPKISDIIITGSEPIHLFDTPLMLARNGGLTVEQRMAKRVMDVVLSFLAILLSAPFMLVFALCIKLYDRGPVFYTQERLTRDGQTFQIIKFRSMTVDAEKEGARLAAKGDSRITPIGRFLRAAHLDELPQIFNILKGDMSLVGPRPERREIAEEYEGLIPEFRFRLKVKAGLTGYAQIYGKYNTAPYDKLKLDLTYIENYSVWMDFKLMLMTFKIMFQKENTEGVDKEQKTAIEKQDG